MGSNENPGFAAFVNWGFQALLLALVTWGVTELSSLSKSVSELNVKMAVVVTKGEAQSRDIERISEQEKQHGEALRDLSLRMIRLEKK